MNEGSRAIVGLQIGETFFSFIELQLDNEPFISQAVLLGDRRPFIAALVVADRSRIAESIAHDAASLSDRGIELALWTQVERVNSRLEEYEQIRQIAVLHDDFPDEARSINLLQKVKVDRKVVAERYRAQIDAIYAMPERGGSF